MTLTPSGTMMLLLAQLVLDARLVRLLIYESIAIAIKNKEKENMTINWICYLAAEASNPHLT